MFLKYWADMETTRNYRDKYNAPCGCIYCENFRQSFESRYPEPARILRSLGLELDRPLEIEEYGWSGEPAPRLYACDYCVKDTLQEDGLPICRGELNIDLYQPEGRMCCKSTGMEPPYFFVRVEGILLPWVLDIPPDM